MTTGASTPTTRTSSHGVHGALLRHGRRVGLGAVVLIATACGGDDMATPPSVVPDVPETVELGALPDPFSDASAETLPSTTAAPTTSTTTTTEPRSDPVTAPVADEVEGNRVLFVGDTVLSSTAPRNDGVMCEVLQAFGWQAEIEAEVGRFVDFGRVVLDARLDPDPGEDAWDVVAMMLGTHFDGDVGAYQAEMRSLIGRLSPRPVIVYTIVEDDTYQAELNEFIRELPDEYPNVVIIDFAEIAAAEPDKILADTPSGLSEEGRGRLALFTAATLGEPSSTADAGCIDPVFTDDSAIVL